MQRAYIDIYDVLGLLACVRRPGRKWGDVHMIKEFDKLKQQLAELSEAVNKFESEAVQLRIVELVLDRNHGKQSFAEYGLENYVSGPDAGQAFGDEALQFHTRPGRKKRSVDSARGAVAALNDLIAGDFFEEKRTISDIVAHCESAFGTRYKSNAFSGPLSRHARTGALEREKNEDGKFVYFKPSAAA